MTRPTPRADAVRRSAAARGLRTELLVGNDSNRLGDFDPVALHRLLSDADRSARVAVRVADRATTGGRDGVSVDLERVRAGDADGLTRFVQQVHDALPATATVSVDVSASTSRAAYRSRGYDRAGLDRAADVVVLMTTTCTARPGPAPVRSATCAGSARRSRPPRPRWPWSGSTSA